MKNFTYILIILIFCIIGSSCRLEASDFQKEIKTLQEEFVEVSPLVFVYNSSIKPLDNNIYSFTTDNYSPDDILPFQTQFGVKTSHIKFFERVDCMNQKLQVVRFIAYRKSDNKSYADIAFDDDYVDIPPSNTVGFKIYNYVCNFNQQK